MKRSIVVSMTVLALAFAARAESVTLERAKLVARAWLAREGRVASPLSAAIQRSSAVKLPELGGDVGFYAVKFQGGGTVFTSADDTAAPVVAFSEKDVEFDLADVDSPLFALLRRDFRIRRDAASARKFAGGAADSDGRRFAAGYDRQLARNRAEWVRLAGRAADVGEPSARSFAAASGEDEWLVPTYTAGTLADIRVAPLVRSRWGQADVDGAACYNYYTPNEEDPLDETGFVGRSDNAACGCVATALAQTLRHFAFDREVTRTNEEFECSYEKRSGEVVAVPRRLSGGRYDWARMTLDPAGTDGFDEGNAREIGRLTADCGAAVHTRYGQDRSGAYLDDVVEALTGVFGYAGARLYDSPGRIGVSDWGEAPVEPGAFPSMRADELRRVFYANLDAGLPVLCGLTGHAVVADGYGYSREGLDYVHLNMGWSGQSDLWYLLPNVCCDADGRPEVGTMLFESCVYNIFVTNAATDVVMSGRVVDDDGAPVVGARVTLRRPDDEDPVAEAVTGETGVWGLVVPPGTYEVAATDGVKTECETYAASGNRWGCDVVLAPPSVRNLMQEAPANEYASLDRAILAAGTNDTLEVFRRTRLCRSVVIDRALAIRTAAEFADEPTNCLIRCLGEASITVAPGVRAEFRGLAFRSAAAAVIGVETNGVAAFAGKLGVGTVRTADTNGFELVGAVDFTGDEGFFVDCAEAKAEGARFGSWTGGDSVRDSANRVLDPWDPDLGGVAADDGSLVWGFVPADPRVAVAYVDDGSDAPVHYRTLDRLFRQNPDGDLAIRLIKDVEAFGTELDLTGRKVEIASDGGPFTISGCTGRTGFLIGPGGGLTLEDVTFEGFAGRWFVRLPQSGGVFTLGENACLRGFRVAGDAAAADFPNGLVSMLGGRMEMKPGSAIVDCAYENGVGGVISLYGGKLDIDGGSIVGCRAEQDGVVYYCPCFDGAELRLSGSVEISGNLVNATDTSMRPADVCLDTAGARISVADGLASDSLIGVCGVGVGSGREFAVILGGDPDPGAFFADDDGRSGKPLTAVRDGGVFRWVEYEESDGQCDPAEATALVTYAGEAVQLHYRDLGEALANLRGEAEIVLTRDQYLTEDAVVRGRVTIDGGGNRIFRVAESALIVDATGDLTLTDVTVGGYDFERPWDYWIIGDSILVAEFRGSNRRIVEVDGGRLTLGGGAEICELGSDRAVDRMFDPAYAPELAQLLWLYTPVYAPIVPDDYDRASCAVVVYHGGELVMEPGSSIHDCWNLFYESPASLGVTAGVLVEESVAILRGGTISDCRAWLGSAFDVCQEGEVRIDGDVVMTGNLDVNGDRSDFMLEDLSRLYLDRPFAGEIGFAPGVLADTNRVTEVITALTEAEVAESAKHFFNNLTGARAVGVTCDGGYLVVWSTALADDDRYYERTPDGGVRVWTLIGGVRPPSVASYRPAGDFVYDAEMHHALAASIGCELSEGAFAIDAGEYVCRIRPGEGYVWEDGGDGEAEVVWRITPAPLRVCPKEGQSRGFILPEDEIAEHEPVLKYTVEGFCGADGVANTMDGAMSHEHYGMNVAGESLITVGTLRCTNGNYRVTAFNPFGTTFLVIRSRVDDYTKRDPQAYTVTTNVPTAFAFSEIVRSVADLTCTVTLTNLVKGADYSLYTATAIDGGFAYDPSDPFTNFTAAADGPFTLTVRSPSPSLFWRAAGRTTYITNQIEVVSQE